MQDVPGFSEVCKEIMFQIHMWPGPWEYTIMAAQHMGYDNVKDAMRSDLHYNQVKALVSTSCTAAPITPLPAALSW